MKTVSSSSALSEICKAPGSCIGSCTGIDDNGGGCDGDSSDDCGSGGDDDGEVGRAELVNQP